VNLSPTDEDAGGLANLVQALPVSEAFGLPGEYPESWGCQAFLDALADKDLRLHPLRKGDSIPLLDGAALKVIYSPEGEKVSAAHNPNRSLGLLLTLPGAEGPVQILFAGNLGKEGIRAIGKDFSTLLHPDWLAAPRHGAESANPEEWARGLTPSHILVSDSRNHPADQEIYRLANPAAKVLCTALEGAVELEVGPGSRKRFRNYREGIWQNF
jgi:beta-lactamase superfamily II metal-dependent hydrolase